MEFTDTTKSDSKFLQEKYLTPLSDSPHWRSSLFGRSKSWSHLLEYFIWSVIFAVALYPMYLKLARRMKKGLAASFNCINSPLIIVLPQFS
jgi:hypothetical protein